MRIQQSLRYWYKKGGNFCKNLHFQIMKYVQTQMQISNDYDNYIAKNKYIIVFKIESEVSYGY